MSDASIISLNPTGLPPGATLLAAANFPAGTPVFQVQGSTPATVNKSQGSTLTGGVARCIGLASEPGISGRHSKVVFNGHILTLTASEWEAISLNDGTGLIPGSPYYLSAATAGLLVTTLPIASGNVGVQVGIALSHTAMLVLIMPGLVAHA
jgi:hypothetical protein